MTLPVAFAIGFSVASLPGPILALVATESLRRGMKAGLLASLAPVLIDAAVIVPLALFLRASLFRGSGATFLGLVGAGFLFWLGIQALRGSLKRVLPGAASEASWNARKGELSPFLKGTLAHLTNPYPYLYWGTVGVTFIRQGFEDGDVVAAALFPLGFWAGAITFNVLTAYISARTKRLLPPSLEPYIHRASGVLLIAAAFFLAVKVWQGIN